MYSRGENVINGWNPQENKLKKNYKCYDNGASRKRLTEKMGLFILKPGLLYIFVQKIWRKKWPSPKKCQQNYFLVIFLLFWTQICHFWPKKWSPYFIARKKPKVLGKELFFQLLKPSNLFFRETFSFKKNASLKFHLMIFTPSKVMYEEI